MVTGHEAFTAFVATRGAALSRYAYVLSGDREEAADLVQDALLRTYARARGGAGFEHVEAYVRRAILTGYLDRRRREQRWRAIRHLLPGRGAADSAEEEVVLRSATHEVLAGLSPRQRACLVLRYYEDLPVAEIAAQLRCGPGTVKRHLSDGLRRVADRLGAEEGRIG
ncbi:sigma-70 family RNA polymerase sigma factor [Actinoplanes sp. N902-109]|uniref:sigma-70 family RNA polymerase sigma factor n=1 Tax=Actinoplanes sp. (strain N902-109) TaxID=649831 RepID=UPI0003A2141E|nr:sigma-70 family RNA polymerase sigma factor [Actinoplanes sp. N902-109]